VSKSRIEIRPQPGAQERYLSCPADIAIYGGAAFGGKSWALLVEPLRHVNNPDFGAVIFRRTSPQITNEGGLWDEAGSLYPLVGGTPRVGDLEWRFPSGACISFRHLQHEDTKYDWQGSQVCLIEFDELTHFSETQFFYMLSRNRSTCGVRPYVRASTNPDSGSWVRGFLSPWLDGDHPCYARDGELRYLLRVNGKLVWGKSRAELKEKHPDLAPKSVTFIRARIYDNRIGMAKDPGYLANLQALPAVEKARLLDGDWDVKRDGLVYPDFGSCVEDDFSLPEGERIGGIDWGWNNPFAALDAVLDRDDVLWVHWERYGSHLTIHDNIAALKPRGDVRWWADPAGADQTAEFRRAGLDVVPSVHVGGNSLDTGIARVEARIRSKRLKVSRACAGLIREAGIYHYDPTTGKIVDKDNHALAALRYMITGIDRGKEIDRRTPEEQAEAEKAAKEAEEQAQEEREREWHDVNNDHWWS
jgi:hypothetical protein